MRLVVTGANGFLGRNALLHLPHDWQIAALYRPQNPVLPAFVDRYQLSHVTPIACDLSNAEQVAAAVHNIERTLGAAPWDACLYLASNTDIPGSLDHPVNDLTINTIGLLHTLAHWPFDHLVYLSSGAVYADLPGIVGVETPVAPTLPYAISKLASEHYVRAFTLRRGNPQRATIVRFFGAYGPHEPARKLYTKLVRRFAIARNPAYTIQGDGLNYIDAMYIEDAITALQRILMAPPEVAEPPDAVHMVDLGLGARETVLSVVQCAARVFDIVPQLTYDTPPPEYITCAMDPAPFNTQYGFAPLVSLDEGFKRLATHLRREDDYAAG